MKAGLVAAMIAVAGCSTTSDDTAAANAFEAQREEAMATLINLRGQLCAKVIFVSPELASGERQVNCEEYRDSKKAKTKHNLVVYMVNLESGSVRFGGR